MGFGADSVPLRPDLGRLVGAADQLVSVTRVVLDDGPGRGAPVLSVRNPAGMSFELLLDRAMDVGWADAAGIPLAWRSPRGSVASAFHEPAGVGWTRTFPGGLLTTCGLSSTGAPSTVDGTHHPLHGRVGHIPAENVRWQLIDDDGVLSVEITGDVVEAALGQPALTLHRRIVASTVRPELRIQDTVRNVGWEPAPHMFRHHLNLGAPLVVPGTIVTATADPIDERDHAGPPSIVLPWTLDVEPGTAPELVLHCRPHPGPTAQVEVRSPDGVALLVEQDCSTWTRLILWRNASAGVNVLGIEPSTSRDLGRLEAEESGDLIMLAPGQSRSYRTTVRLESTRRPTAFLPEAINPASS